MTDLRDCILVVEDDFLIAEGFCAQLEDMGWAVCGTADTAETAVALAQAHRPIIVLMDLRLRGESDGVDAARAICATVGSGLIFVTGSREPAALTRIKVAHASSVLFKPISFRQLQAAVEAAAREKRGAP
jgi:DNA-binding response OmpR family regulator